MYKIVSDPSIDGRHRPPRLSVVFTHPDDFQNPSSVSVVYGESKTPASVSRSLGHVAQSTSASVKSDASTPSAVGPITMTPVSQPLTDDCFPTVPRTPMDPSQPAWIDDTIPDNPRIILWGPTREYVPGYQMVSCYLPGAVSSSITLADGNTRSEFRFYNVHPNNRLAHLLSKNSVSIPGKKEVTRIMKIAKELATAIEDVHKQDRYHGSPGPNALFLVPEDELNPRSPLTLKWIGIEFCIDNNSVTDRNFLSWTPEFPLVEEARIQDGRPMDIWQFGRVLLHVFLGRSVINENADGLKVSKLLSECDSEFNSELERMFLDLIKFMLAQEPEKRPTIGKVIEYLESMEKFREVSQ